MHDDDKLDIDLLRWNEVTVTEDKEKAEMFDRYFSAVFTQESSESFRQISAAKISVPMQDIHVTQEQIEAKLKSLNTDKSPGLDILHPRILYEAWQEIAEPLKKNFWCFIESRWNSSRMENSSSDCNT